MTATLELVGRQPITFESANEKEDNIISQLGYVSALDELYNRLWEQKASIEALTRHHLGLDRPGVSCTLLAPDEWIRGSFNICMPIRVESNRISRKLMFRCPMPHKLAETQYPGTVDEKLSCEVASYVWMQENCPDVRIPHLAAFGFTDGTGFSHVDNRSLLIRIAHRLRRFFYRLCRAPLLSMYSQHSSQPGVDSAFLLLEYIGPESGVMLSNTWPQYRTDTHRRKNLFRDISRIMLSLARVPQTRIGSFCFNRTGTITLSNRPLSCSLLIAENEGVTRTMERDCVYQSTDSFASDMLSIHDNRFLCQPNATYNKVDCQGQMATKTLLRVLSHRHIMRRYRHGPFFLQLTDLHAGNIFVDRDWNVPCLIDLEWICSLPVEMLNVPYWLSGRSIDGLEGEHLLAFDVVRREFMSIFEHVERHDASQHNVSISNVMTDVWESKGMWFWHCLSSINAMYALVDQHLSPQSHLSLDDETALSKLWIEDADAVVDRKMEQKRVYDGQL